jgi:hypothetical protein
MFDLDTGKTGRMKHNELNDRIKTAAQVLKLDYSPEKGSKGRVAVEQIKTRHKAVRNEKIKSLDKSLKVDKSLDLYKYSNQLLAKENDELKIERKTLKEELQALKEQKAIDRAILQENNAPRPDYAQMEAKYKAMELELKVLKSKPQAEQSITVTIPASMDNALSEIKKTVEEVSNQYSDQRSQSENEQSLRGLKSNFTHAEFDTAEKIIEKSKDKGILSDKINEVKLKAEIEKALNKRDNIIKQSFSLSERVLQSGKTLIRTFENIKESTEKGLKAFISKFQGKSSPEPQKERTNDFDLIKKGLDR